MAARILQEAIVDGGIRSVNFFNGRLLTGQDLSREQVARREADRRVAQGAGAGIAHGLEVTASPAEPAGRVVTIQPGLAVSRGGRTLRLENAVDVILGRRALPRIAATRTFDACTLKGGTYAARPGIYLLTIAPAEDREGRALTNALDDSSVPCNTDTIVEAVQFRLLALDPFIDDALLQDTARLRSRLAHGCFGLHKLAAFLRDPFAGDDRHEGLLAQLPVETLTDCDVPLAVVALSDKMDFVDMWSVRRRVTRRSSAGPWSLMVDDERRATGEAAFLQFQEQAEAMAIGAGGLRALDAFDFLPAAGLLRMPADAKALDAAADVFFDGLTTRGPAFIEGARLEPLLRASFAYPPIDLQSGELIWLYWVRENREAIDYGLVEPTPRPALVFASGHMPYAADARFDVGKWDYANVALDR